MKTITVVHGAGAARYRDAGSGVLEIRLSGPVTPKLLENMRPVTLECVAQLRAWGVLARLDRALLVIAQEHLKPVALPLAMVVAPRSLEEMRAYAWAMATQGYLRGAFTDAQEAFLWLLTKRGLGLPAPRSAQKSREPASGAADRR